LDQLPLPESIEATRTKGAFLLEGVQRAQGTFNDPNHFGFFVALCTLALLGLLIVSRLRRLGLTTALCAIALLGAVMLLVGSYSRSSWLLAVVAVVIWAATAGRSVLRAVLNRRMVIAGVALLLVALPFAVPVISNRINPSERGNAMSNNVHERTMKLAIRLAEDHPVQGVGLGAYGSYANEPPLVSSSHSTLLTTAAELGLPGLLLLVSIMVATTVAGMRSALREEDAGRRAVVAALVAAYAGMAVANIAYEVWMDDFQWVLFGILMAVTSQPAFRLPALPRPRRTAAA
jgi:O-antigen ligase